MRLPKLLRKVLRRPEPPEPAKLGGVEPGDTITFTFTPTSGQGLVHFSYEPHTPDGQIRFSYFPHQNYGLVWARYGNGGPPPLNPAVPLEPVVPTPETRQWSHVGSVFLGVVPPPVPRSYKLVGTVPITTEAKPFKLVGTVNLQRPYKLVGTVYLQEDDDPRHIAPRGQRRGATDLRLVVDWAGEGRRGAFAPHLRPSTPHTQMDLGMGLKADVTPWLRSVDWRLGRDGKDPLQATDDGGSLTAVVDNRTGIFDAHNWPAPNAKPFTGRAVMLWAPIGNDEWEAVWGGYLVDVLPEWEAPGSDAKAMARITAIGPLNWLGKRSLPVHVNISVFNNVPPTADQAMDAMLDVVSGGEPLWPAADRFIGQGRMRLNAGQLAASGVLGLSDALVRPRQTLAELARADGGLVFGNKWGCLAYESPDDRRRRLNLRPTEVQPADLVALPIVNDNDHPQVIKHIGYLDGVYNIFETDAVSAIEDTTFKTKDFTQAETGLARRLNAGERALMRIPGSAIVDQVNVELAAIGSVVVSSTPNVPGAINAFIVSSYPDLWVRVEVDHDAMGGPFEVWVSSVQWRGRRADRGFVLIRAQNNEAIADYFPSEYNFPGHLYDTSAINLNRAQRWVSWAAKAWAYPRLRAEVMFRVADRLGNDGLLGLSVGDAVRSRLTGATADCFIESVHGTYVRGRNIIDLTWTISDASPYRIEE